MAKGTMIKHMQERFGGRENCSLEPPLPASLNIELNNTCNQMCEFCYAHGPHSQSKIKPSIMDFDFACSLMRQAAEIGIGKKEIGFYSEGEVFLYPRFDEIVSYAKELGFSYTFITTNGALAIPSKMKKVVNAGLDSIRFSLNAANRETYKRTHGKDDFDAVIENIKWLHKYREETGAKISISVSSVITKKTLGMQKDIRDLVNDYVDEILFIPVITQRDEKHEFDVDITSEFAICDDDNLPNEYKGCPIPFNTMYIDAEGKVFICCETYFTKLRVANLHENFSLKSAWYSSVMQKYRQALLKKHLEGTFCKSCIQVWGGAERLQMD